MIQVYILVYLVLKLSNKSEIAFTKNISSIKNESMVLSTKDQNDTTTNEKLFTEKDQDHTTNVKLFTVKDENHTIDEKLFTDKDQDHSTNEKS